ncbi:hypothetical protein FGG78_23525 [Thioclava sp. BHET1]|nr:hypothetical protein FGG78_23525 [Thioclava sp. BHET1]
MSCVAVLKPVESLWLDPARLSEIYANHNALEAENLIGRALSELALLLTGLMRHYGQSDLSAFARDLDSLQMLASALGMVGVAGCCGAVQDCLQSGDSTALAATWARLLRAGEQTMDANWDDCGLSL